MFTCSVPEKFQQLIVEDKSPVCLFPTRDACDTLNMEMLDALGNEKKILKAKDCVEETTTKRAQSELDRLNKNCNYQVD